MKKILINLFSKSLTVEDFESFSNEVPDKFEIYNYQFSVNEMFPDIVEAIINTLQKEVGVDLLNTSIVLQTNVADLGHFCAKFYAELLDAVIIITKNVELLTDTLKDYNFMLKVLRTNMEKLRLNKIYIHDNNKIDLDYLKFLYLNRLFNEIEPVKYIKIEKVEKLRFDSIFEIDGGSIETNFSLNIKNYFQNDDLHIEDDPVTYLFESFGMYQLLKFFMSIETFSLEDKNYYLRSILTHAVKVNKKDELLNYIIEYIDTETLPLQTFADYNYFCMLLEDKSALKRQYTFLKKNYNVLNPIQVHALITNSLFYQSMLNQNTYSELSKDRMCLMGKINHFFRKKVYLPKVQKRISNRVAIVSGQLLGISHAPTKWAIDYANMLKKYNPELEIKIFVEDWANYSPGELTWMNIFTSANSAMCHEQHKEFLHSEIEVYYSDSKLERKKRIQQDMNAIASFRPSIIYKMSSIYNISVDLLYPYFPIISHTMGGAEDCEFVDIFTGGYHEYDMKRMYDEQNIIQQEYYHHRIGVETPKSTTIKSRAMYKLSDSDFVIVTVGNRLESEITIEFVDRIIETLDSDKDIKWLIVGVKNISIIKNNYGRYIVEKRIIFIPYEKQLFDFYKICDVYVNPVRQAGGTSAAWAMKARLPIITNNPVSDVGEFAGKDNCICLNEYPQEILKLKNDIKYYEERSYAMFRRIEDYFSFKNTNEDLKKIFELAKQRFEKRSKEK
ncbi:glycosyltransferase [Lysinibacillus capsici]|uniref:glycosyltransferase n=1 Tax=Lysinibacillus capsici TaxID=2115968 RepID=UPI0032E3908E